LGDFLLEGFAIAIEKYIFGELFNILSKSIRKIVKTITSKNKTQNNIIK